jgi:hypothetical protein
LCMADANGAIESNVSGLRIEVFRRNENSESNYIHFISSLSNGL